MYWQWQIPAVIIDTDIMVPGMVTQTVYMWHHHLECIITEHHTIITTTDLAMNIIGLTPITTEMKEVTIGATIIERVIVKIQEVEEDSF